MGGKFRQRKAIVEALRPYAREGFTYVEPFCGAMWSAAAVCDHLRPGKVILNDINRPLIALWNKVLSDGVDWLPVDMDEVERNYQWYKNKTSLEPQRRSTGRKADSLRPFHPLIVCGSYLDLDVPDGSVLYCDPPYEGRVKCHHFESFDYEESWEWVRDLSARCTVMVSCFQCPDDFVTVHSWGDTVTRHNHGKGSDGTCEKLVMPPC